MPYKQKCERCNQEYLAIRQSQRFCGPSCRHQPVPLKEWTKTCEHCSNEYTPTSNRQRFCKDCVPNKRARKNLQFYGVTEKEFQAALSEANGHCPLCGVESDEEDRHHKLVVDHDHKTTKFRGMLCRNCNMGMGFIDNDDWLAKALAWRDRGR